MARNTTVVSAKVRAGVAVFLIVCAVSFFVASAFGLDLAKPAWGMFFVGVYVIFGNVVGDFLLRAVTGLVATAQDDRRRDDDDAGVA